MTEAGFEIDLGLHIGAAVGRAMTEALASNRQAERERRLRLNGEIMPLSGDLQPILLTAGAGILDQPRLCGPAMGWVFQLDGMGAQGFTAGSVAVFINGVAGLQLFNFSSAGVFYQRQFRFLRYGERLVFQATGITGTASVWISGITYTEQHQGEVLT